MQNPNFPQPPFAPTPPSDPVSTALIGQAWEMLKPQIGMWIVAMLIYGAISGALNGVSGVINAAGDQNPSFVVVALLLLIALASAAIGFLLNAGIYKMAIHHVRTGQADIAKIFEITDVIVPVIVASLLATIASLLGLVACIIPGLLISLLFLLAIPLIVDQKAEAIDALRLSWDTTRPHLGSIVVLSLLLLVINIAGFCACVIGLFVTYPLTFLTFALVYRNLFGVPSEPALVSNLTPPPISDPRG